jgi:sugar lactone lactonase YvrE
MRGDIWVYDREENNVRITTLTTDGVVKHYDRGLSEVTLKKPFNPFGIVADKSGHVLVADWSNHSDHLLDLSGQFIGFLLSEKDGIRGPNAMALDKEGNLWVGDTKSTVWIFKYSRVGENGPPS